MPDPLQYQLVFPSRLRTSTPLRICSGRTGYLIAPHAALYILRSIRMAGRESKKGQARRPAPFASHARLPGLLRPEIHDMHISAETHVVGQVPADVIRVIVNNDLVRIPQPAVAET